MRVAVGAGILVAAALVWLLVPLPVTPPTIASRGDPERGEYVLRMGGCVACHTDEKNGGAFLAGGRALPTPFGTFYTPNITPDPRDRHRRLVDRRVRAGDDPGRARPTATPYYPAFPYTSYARMTVQDLADLKAYLDTVEPVANQVPGARARLSRSAFARCSSPGRSCFSRRAPFEPDPGRSESWNRGAYLVNGPAHCGECHTPRNSLGAADREPFPRRHARRAGRQARAQHHAASGRRHRRVVADRHHLCAADRASCPMATCSAAR